MTSNDLVSSARWPGEHSEQLGALRRILPATITCPAGPWSGWNGYQRAHQRSLQIRSPIPRCITTCSSEPFVLHRCGYPRFGNPEPAERGCAVQRVHHIPRLRISRPPALAQLVSATGISAYAATRDRPTTAAALGPVIDSMRSPRGVLLTNTAGYAGGGTGFRANTAANPRLSASTATVRVVPPEAGPPAAVAGASGNFGCHCAEPDLQPDASRDGG